jgi:hypothetical protein
MQHLAFGQGALAHPGPARLPRDQIDWEFARKPRSGIARFKPARGRYAGDEQVDIAAVVRLTATDAAEQQHALGSKLCGQQGGDGRGEGAGVALPGSVCGGAAAVPRAQAFDVAGQIG